MTDAPRFLDFDAAFEELDSAPLPVRLLGETWELPGVMPAAVMVRVLRLRSEHGDEWEIDNENGLLLALDMIPRQMLDEWMARGLTLDRLVYVVAGILSTYMKGEAADVDEAGEASGPGQGTRSGSSDTGPSSLPTSVGSTDSTSPVPSVA